MRELLKRASIVLTFCFAGATASPAQVTFTTLASFDGTNGFQPNGLIQATDGNFYGTTQSSVPSPSPNGTVFRVTPGGALTLLHSFCALTNCADGAEPIGDLVQGPDGNFYGTTYFGGKSNGTVFRITPAGTLTTLHSFVGYPNNDGARPAAGLTLGDGGNFYGTTTAGGLGLKNSGTIFKITPAGALTILHSFCGYPCGEVPSSALIPLPDGLYYFGTTMGGGANYNDGTVFKITPGGTLTTPHIFDGANGSSPNALVRGSDGNFYGTTVGGGTSANCTNGCGAVFKITSGGTLTTLYSFCAQSGCPDGYSPEAGLVQGTDGNFYGTTVGGGASNRGTIFRITPKGNLTTLHNFYGNGSPIAGLLQGTDGRFYGTTFSGGTSSACPDGCGTIFKLSVGLGPFVTTQTSSGKVGANVIILGNNLTGATGVSFNGTPATTFTVVSASEITATVPAGATTGKIQVTATGGTLTSNKAFYVTPQVLSFTPASGAMGASVQITGASLTQTNVVTFGGVKATAFTVNSDTQITATVPTGAKNGKVAVSTSGGTAWSATNFTVQ